MVVAFYPPQGLGDSSDVDNLFSGIFQACNESGGQLEMLEVIPKSWDMGIFTVALYLEVVKSFLESDESAPDFLFLFYEGYLPILEELSEDFEDANITVLLFDSKKNNLPFVKRVSIPLYGVSYLAGLASKELLKNNNSPRLLSILANSSDQSLIDSIKGFALGFNPNPLWDGKILIDWDYSESAPDFYVLALKDGLTDGGYNQFSALYLLMKTVAVIHPYDMVFPICRGSISGIIKFNREKGEDSPYTIGSFTNLNETSNRIPFSIVKHTERVAKECLLRWVNEEEIPQYSEFGLKDGYTELEISKDYKSRLSNIVEKNLELAIKLEKEYEEKK